MVQSDKFKFVKKLFFGAAVYGIYSIWEFPFEEMIIYGNLFEPIRIKLYGTLILIIVAFLIYPYLSIQYEVNLVREFKYMKGKGKKRNKYSNISIKKDDKSWSDVIGEAKNKDKDVDWKETLYNSSYQTHNHTNYFKRWIQKQLNSPILLNNFHKLISTYPYKILNHLI